MGRKVELSGLDGRGERTAWKVKIVLGCDSVVPVVLSKTRAVRELGDARARLLGSALVEEDKVGPLKRLREQSKNSEAVEAKRASWEARAGRKIDWERGRRIRDSLVTPLRARDVLLRVQDLNLQVGERVPFLRGGDACPLCGKKETLEHYYLRVCLPFFSPASPSRSSRSTNFSTYSNCNLVHLLPMRHLLRIKEVMILL
ncbi:unnamed protein product [Closterium sp. Naga37s-1]|nr:unnamed protein product [Closterium sp. Naga37s-1]